MKTVLFAAMISLLVSLGGTPFLIRAFRRLGFGQRLREDWGDIGHHAEKLGTPTMGGVMIIVSVVAGYVGAHLSGGGLGWGGGGALCPVVGVGGVGVLG